MKKKSKLIVLIVVMAVATSSLFTGCKRVDKEALKSDKEQVTLRWVMLGTGEQQDSRIVWDEFNKKLEDYLPNTKVKIEVYPVADYKEKWKLIAASNEKVDLAWAGWLIDLPSEARKGAYLPLDNLIDDYAPALRKELPEILFEGATVDGKIYAIQNYQMIAGKRIGLRTHKDLASKYWDIEKAKKIFYSNETWTEECYDEVESYLENLKKNGELGLGVSIDTFRWATGKGRQTIVDIEGGLAAVKRGDDSYNLDFDYNLTHIAKMADWYQKGYIRKDVLTVQNLRQDEGREKGYVLWAHNYFEGESERETLKYGFPIEVIPTSEEYYIDSPDTRTATAISKTSENPERAIKLLELMHTQKGKDLYNLLVYGIEGEHYLKKSEDRIETIAQKGQGTNDSKYGLFKWVVGNAFNAFETQTEQDGWNKYILKLNETAIKSPLLYFKFDDSSVKVEIAQIKAVKGEYRFLGYGTTSNYIEVYEQMQNKLKLAGYDKVKGEIQRQLDEYLKSKGLNK